MGPKATVSFLILPPCTGSAIAGLSVGQGNAHLGVKSYVACDVLPQFPVARILHRSKSHQLPMPLILAFLICLVGVVGLVTLEVVTFGRFALHCIKVAQG